LTALLYVCSFSLDEAESLNKIGKLNISKVGLGKGRNGKKWTGKSDKRSSGFFL